MPTTRRRRTRVPITLPLSSALVDVLLTGDSEADPFLMFEVTADQAADLWRIHGDALRAEARRRGLVVAGMGQDG